MAWCDTNLFSSHHGAAETTIIPSQSREWRGPNASTYPPYRGSLSSASALFGAAKHSSLVSAMREQKDKYNTQPCAGAFTAEVGICTGRGEYSRARPGKGAAYPGGGPEKPGGGAKGGMPGGAPGKPGGLKPAGGMPGAPGAPKGIGGRCSAGAPTARRI